MMTCKLRASVVLLMVLALPLVAQAPSLAYQNRGRYNEGTRTEPSTGPAGLELIAALVDYEEPSTTLPPKFRAQFYLPTQDKVDLTIREIKPVYFYWLDKVHPASAWRQGAQNRFEWPTATVIRALNWESAPLTLDQLGATVRIGRLTPGEVEQVAPVALYQSSPPASANGYRFVFRPSSQMRLKFQLFKDHGNAPVGTQEFRSVLAEEPHVVTWNALDWQDGWYRLVISGYTLSNNVRIDKVVRFYHAHKA
jgi:hypothetical protein